MAMIAIPVPHDVGRLFRSIDVPGNRDPSDHITLLYFGDDLSMKTIVKAIPLVYDIVSKMNPFLISTKKIETFPKGDKGYPIIAPIESEQLQDLHSKLKKSFKSHGISFSNKFPEYKPHLTLGYDKKKFKVSLPKTQWQVNEVALYGGDTHDEKLYVSFPFNLDVPMKKSANYILQLSQIYKRAAEPVLEQNLTVYFQQLLYNMGFFYMNPDQFSADERFANNVWIPILENTQTYGDYDVSITIPAGTFAVQFSGTPGTLTKYLNANIAPKITAGLQKAKGSTIADWTVTEPSSTISFKYMASI